MNCRSLSRALAGLTASIAAIALLGGCGGGVGPKAAGVDASADSALQTLVTAAQKEGELVWYSVPADNIAKAVSDNFAKKYDIKVKYIRLTSADLSSRFSAEAESGKPAADLFLGSLTPFVKQALTKGWTTALANADIPEFPGTYPEKFLVPDSGTAVVQVQPSGIAVNTEQTTKAPINDWKDLLNPAYKGKILLVDPKASAAYTPFWNLMIKENGKEFLTQLKAQNPKLAASAAPGTQQVAAGEAAILMPGVQSTVEDLKAKGAKISYVQPSASTGPELVPGLAAKAAHPSAARLFIHYLMSQDGNAVLNAAPGSGAPRNQQSLPSRYFFNAELTEVKAEEIYQLLGVAAK
jgi:iron(III) transport system substrate-binding protein